MTTQRRRARMAALQALFEVDQTAHDPISALTPRIQEEELSAASKHFASSLLSGVLNNKERIDEIIVTAAPAWPLEQIAVTDRVALEMGIYELCIANEAPLEVAINEAVELAKVFGGENSAAFVNGVLRTVAEREPAQLTV